MQGALISVFLLVCSTTLWVGHLSKLVHQEELYNTFGEFGDVVSIDLIPPRGCAFIVMHRRQDAARCLSKLRNHKLQGKAITVIKVTPKYCLVTEMRFVLQMAWAPGKGVKGKDLKDYWEGDLGVSYIPWSKIKPDIDLEMLEDGGTIDEDTMPAWLKAKAELSTKALGEKDDGKVMGTPNIDTTQPPPVPGAGLLQPPSLTLPLVNPFQINNSLLGMNIPPGMMPNVPIGVPPPNMPSAAMMNNPLLGLNSPFGQGPPPGILQMSMAGPSDNKTPEQKMQNLSDSMLNMPPSFMMAQSEDNMDVEMEDANNPESLLYSDVHPHPALGSDLLAQNIDEQRDYRDERDRDRDRRSSRSRDRGRDRDRNHRDGRDRGKDGNRSDRKDERRDRWNDRDKRGRDERRERSEKTVNDRLWEMAEGYSSRDRPRDRTDISDTAPPLLDKPDFPPLDGPHLLEPEFEDRFRRGVHPGRRAASKFYRVAKFLCIR